jgi:hypothetical protein
MKIYNQNKLDYEKITCHTGHFFFFLSKVSDTIVLMHHNFKVEFKANGCEALEVAK